MNIMISYNNYNHDYRRSETLQIAFFGQRIDATIEWPRFVHKS